MLTDNQRTIVTLIRDNGGEITKAQAVEVLGGNYYHNGGKYVGDILSRMVNAGLIERKKKGIFVLPTKTAQADERQLTIGDFLNEAQIAFKLDFEVKEGSINIIKRKE